MTLEVAGTSHEGRSIWLATVTNTATGPHDEKPAIFVEANIHATEITASTAALHLLHHLDDRLRHRPRRDPRARHPHLLRDPAA